MTKDYQKDLVYKSNKIISGVVNTYLLDGTDSMGDALSLTEYEDYFSDDGYLLWDLQANGYDTEKQKATLIQIAKSFNAQINHNDEIIFVKKKLIQNPLAAFLQLSGAYYTIIKLQKNNSKKK